MKKDVTITQKSLTLNAFLNFIAYHHNIIIEINLIEELDFNVKMQCIL